MITKKKHPMDAIFFRDHGMAGPADELAPAGLRLRADSGTRLVAGGTVLVGGSPVRVLRLTPAGARAVAGWFSGTPVPSAGPARRLARRLMDAGIAHPDWGAADGGHGSPGVADVTVVIPVRDRYAELRRCLAGLRGLPRVIVVDDCSADPAAIAAICAEHGARVERRAVNGGPGAARNTGLAAASTALVAFLDSDCVPRPGWLDRLLPHFGDPAVGAVAPRIVPHEDGTTWLARYEGASSTLDMGARPSIVRPGARVSYVPGAALVVRNAAAGSGFAPGMYVGEDVDFVWRTAAAGWRVRYEPAAVMGHDHRVRFRAWFARRRDYGTSAAALEQLHPGVVRPLYASWWTVGAWTAALSGRPAAAAALTGTATALLARRLSPVTGERWPLPARTNPADNSADNSKERARIGAAWALAVRLAAGGTLAAGRPLGSALSRTWWPAAVPAAIAVPRLRLPVAALILAPPLLDWADRRPPLDPARYVAARLLDDAAYSLGVWEGCLRRRTIRPLLPSVGPANRLRSGLRRRGAVLRWSGQQRCRGGGTRQQCGQNQQDRRSAGGVGADGELPVVPVLDLFQVGGVKTAADRQDLGGERARHGQGRHDDGGDGERRGGVAVLGELVGAERAEAREQQSDDGDRGDRPGGDGVDPGHGGGGRELRRQVGPGPVGGGDRADRSGSLARGGDSRGHGVWFPLQVSWWAPVPLAPGQVTITRNGRVVAGFRKPM
jgi:mycofactocin glycosyltransferase